MPNALRDQFLENVRRRFGPLQKLANSQSLYDIQSLHARLYIRYSKVHDDSRTFFGLRKDDLNQLEGRDSFLCFLWDGQVEPLVIPFSDFEEIFSSLTPAGDNQFKVQVFSSVETSELYIARAGRFNVESYVGFHHIEKVAGSRQSGGDQEYTHSQIQSLLGAIGSRKGFDIWIPDSDRARIDLSLVDRFECRESLPPSYSPIFPILREVDVVWLRRGGTELRALYEVEHSTPIYSGLLRLNDVRLATPNPQPKYGIVANDARKATFMKQVSRPTFTSSGLSEFCMFFDYRDVASWYERIATVK